MKQSQAPRPGQQRRSPELTPGPGMQGELGRQQPRRFVGLTQGFHIENRGYPKHSSLKRGLQTTLGKTRSDHPEPPTATLLPSLTVTLWLRALGFQPTSPRSVPSAHIPSHLRPRPGSSPERAKPLPCPLPRHSTHSPTHSPVWLSSVLLGRKRAGWPSGGSDKVPPDPSLSCSRGQGGPGSPHLIKVPAAGLGLRAPA